MVRLKKSDPRTVFERVSSVIRYELNPDGDILASSRLTDDLGADSLDVIELVIGIEEEFLIEISDEAVETIVTVRDLCRVVVERVGA